MVNRKILLAVIFLVILTIHISLFYLAIGPFSLFTDSAGYLSTADSFFGGNNLLMNPNRPIGLPFLYLFLLKIGGGNIVSIVFFQIIFLVISLIFAVHAAMPKSDFWKKILATLLIIIFSTRSFIYEYMILSEAVFTSGMLLFVGFLFLYIEKKYVREKNSKKNKRNVVGIFLASLLLAYTKSIGIIFLVVAIIIGFF